MNEKQKRQYLAGEARLFGHGGISLISRITGISRPTIIQGMKELDSGDLWERDSRTRSQGGGRKKSESEYEKLPEIIEKIIAGSTYGTPSGVIKWTTLSLRKICRILKEKYNISVCHSTVQKILKLLGYSRQTNKKMEQAGKAAPDRNEQFEFIAGKAEEFLKAGDPVISVDTKKKENIGNFKNPGTEYRRKKDPRKAAKKKYDINANNSVNEEKYDESIEISLKLIKAKTRENKLVRQENIQYGFCRNIYAMRMWGTLISVVMIVCDILLYYNVEIDEMAFIIALGINILFLIVWVFFVNIKIVEFAADNCAEALFDAFI